MSKYNNDLYFLCQLTIFFLVEAACCNNRYSFHVQLLNPYSKNKTANPKIGSRHYIKSYYIKVLTEK